MKKLSKIKLQNAVVLEEQEMKKIYGGSGSGGDYSICGSSNYTHVCACTSIPGTWCGNYPDGNYQSAIDDHCGSGGGSCRPFRQ